MEMKETDYNWKMKKADLHKENSWDKVDGFVLTLLCIMALALAVLVSTLLQQWS